MEQRQEWLEALRDELIERVDRYKVHKMRLENPLDRDMEEQAIELENEDVIDALEDEAEEELGQVLHALERIEEGEGELCERCGEPIDPRRIEAIPYATLCLDCAEQEGEP
ncbi:TraR/DksA family transcriptional regulator [Halomonas sp. MCCC 1A17488]|uniref:TraR/DksA family transcriptional regulator n=1 Tax=Billgrantia sulfidoxydans TaxID=2733484 RepID=A0ABX7W2E7_9GAMM|nr:MULTISPECIES: TraR/DksA family transcriptional regulator [Halomonas]MCE8015895.1 TraR/DksA family transcriptional regulator [Halomonas sp. MCCC 1A17488]MCG3239228.1 TraR/DksA family transcriptional regulator [Halomonas sp. MCCC 1A17488]QPP50837.1 TraR/DksA family transcriptional regulator [Halomonas sp. SS10-MC5]QTP54363.1 TraR/DksA family transcriptional regulator [Halomonas sulfidoxydans]